MRLIPRPGPDPLRRPQLYRRVLQTVFVLFLIWSAAEITAVQRRLDPLTSTDERISRKPRLHHERVFVVGIHWNNEWILRNYWNQAVTDLVQTLGPNNVYLSIYESGSYDNTKGALVELDRMLDPLGVPRNITLSEVTHQDEIAQPPTGGGWLQSEQTGNELRRIPYLSRMRNLSLQPLVDLAKQGIHFDRVLFLNDVVFTVRCHYPGSVTLAEDAQLTTRRSRRRMFLNSFRPRTAGMPPLARWTFPIPQLTTIRSRCAISRATSPSCRLGRTLVRPRPGRH